MVAEPVTFAAMGRLLVASLMQSLLFFFVPAALDQLHHHVSGKDYLFRIFQSVESVHSRWILAQQIYHHVAIQQNHS
jgi:hypothetical protein